ncbi:ExbD/TolR family protein [Cerasicoccus maritimus]|uniref:ExbD/TolR family protein n=1 Tax=Cerasicoccus maritimus TaxID=490089 RepID=UPI002852BECC|nr:biopolymer transporter ExbD [Cerasicoccus maritimus]
MAQLKKKPEEKVSIPIAPMIDCVFLLLIYFMVAATLQKQEADISFQLPGTVEQTEPLEMPDEQIIEVSDEGQVVVNDYAYDSPEASRFMELASMLSRFKQASDANQVEALVTIAPADGANHQTIVKVMDAVSLAGIKGVNFSFGEEF